LSCEMNPVDFGIIARSQRFDKRMLFVHRSPIGMCSPPCERQLSLKYGRILDVANQ
jgi:hypothetical protein